MGLRRLCKAADSMGEGLSGDDVDDDGVAMVGQGKVLDAAATAELRDLATDETAVAIPTGTVLRAAGLFLAERLVERSRSRRSGPPRCVGRGRGLPRGEGPVTRFIQGTRDPEWANLFDSFERSAYRLEGQQMYSSPSEDAALARFSAGHPAGVDLSWRIPRSRAAAAAGKVETIVRIVVEPPTAYTRLELTVYPELVEVGEDIRIIAVPQGCRPPELPLHDYWLFDDRLVWKMHYYENFRFHGAELLDDPEVVAEHLRYRDIALTRAVSLHEYLATCQPGQEHSTA